MQNFSRRTDQIILLQDRVPNHYENSKTRRNHHPWTLERLFFFFISSFEWSSAERFSNYCSIYYSCTMMSIVLYYEKLFIYLYIYKVFINCVITGTACQKYVRQTQSCMCFEGIYRWSLDFPNRFLVPGCICNDQLGRLSRFSNRFVLSGYLFPKIFIFESM